MDTEHQNIRIQNNHQAGGVVRDILGGRLDLLARRMMAAASSALAGEVTPLLKVVDMGRD